ncbi:MAG TPA: tetratricopeptide repeat protein [Pilimelia sp.]|nr:tetratricopeptide repeat protein [Pilimelia sp.]
MDVSGLDGRSAALPDPGAARTLDDVAEALRALKVWAGNPSYETIKDRVNAAWTAAGRPPGELTKKTTVVDCFRAGRRRLNADLVVAVAAALHPDGGYVAQWQHALRVVGGETQAAAQVRAQDALPADLAQFTGRSAELDRLRRSLRRGGGGDGEAPICAIEGMAGVGKTQLVVHIGHVLAREEPFEGVLFVNLRGFHPDPAQPPADPAAVLDSFLRLLGVPGQQVPHDLNARAALYRRRLAGRRALVVLDNAADENQVRPLLPDSPLCVTLVTSRHRLVGLHPAVHLALDVFAPAEALDFLTRAAPRMPVGDDPDAPARIARCCGHLPLALALVAAHMRTRPGWTLTDHADRLDERRRHHRLDSGMELALGLSYHHLPADRQRMLRLLALHPGPDIGTHAAAALGGMGLAAARGSLRHLAAEHLLQQTGTGRVVLHELVRAYAAARASDTDRPPERRAALTRLFGHYLHTAATAMDILYPAERDRRPRIAAPATPAPVLADPEAARGWLDTERVNLMAAAAHTATHGWSHHATRLAATLYRYLDNGGHVSDAIAVHTHARQAARRGGDRAAEAHALTDLAAGYWRQSGYQQAADHYQQALNLFRDIGDTPGEARALSNLSAICWRRGHYPQATDHAQRALKLYGEIGDRFGEAQALANLGGAYRRLGRYPEAADHYQQALTLFREIGDRQGEAVALGNLGLVYEGQGRYSQATGHLQQALLIYRELGNRSGEAYLLTSLGLAYRGLGHHRQATHHHRQALTLFRDLGDTAGEAEALNALGETLLASGQPGQARMHYDTALALATDTGDRHEQARAHNGLAHAYHATGDNDRARHHWQHALAIYTDLDLPEADQVRARLTDLDGQSR